MEISVKDVSFKEYQMDARKTAIYPGRGSIGGLMYTILGLNGEAGECAERVKKYWRDGHTEQRDFYENMVKELGDVIWYVAAACDELGLAFEKVAALNLEKLQERKRTGALHGEGDNR